jgi:Rrf2 family protein
VLAEFHELGGSYLVKTLQSLEQAGIVRSEAGRVGGFQLARPPEKITVLDVFVALEGDSGFFRCTEIRQRGPMPARGAACRQPCVIAAVFDGADDAYRAALGRTTVADLVDGTRSAVGVRMAQRISEWLARSGET